MGDFKFTITFEQKIPNFADASVPLTQCAEKIVESAKRNLRQQKSPDGTMFVPLAESTIKRKRRQGLGWTGRPDLALFAKGIMFRNIKIIDTRKKNTIAVGVEGYGSPPRDLLALIHQEMGVPSKRGRIARPFLGVDKQTEEWINNRMQRWANRALKNAQTKVIKYGGLT